MTDYTKIDDAICKAIAAGRNAAFSIVEATNGLTKPVWHKYDIDGGRVVGRRLQALKKAGKISYAQATGWVIGGAK